MNVWLNGELVAAERACIRPSDRGFLLGDGLFETLRCYGGKVFALDDHLARLEASARAVGIALDGELLGRGARELLADSGLADARMRITVTSGRGSPGPARGAGPPTLLITVSPLASWPAVASALVAPWRRDERSRLTGIKTTSSIEYVLALAHAHEQGADEALFLNSHGHVCEATSANVFVVQAGGVSTPDLASGCLAGITRERVLALCDELGIEVRETKLTAQALRDADEAFLTSSTREIQPLVRVDGQAVGAATPGPITKRLAQQFSALVRRELAL